MKKLFTSGIISLAMASALMAQEGDIVFVIDESGSMAPKIQVVIDNVETLVDALDAATVDYQLGLVGFGSYNKPNPRVVTQLTSDSTVFAAGLQNLLPVGGAYEYGFGAVALGLSTAMEPETFRPDAGTCVIMLTDEDADDPGEKGNALTALSNRDAIYYGIVNLSGRTQYGSVGNTANDYGPNPGNPGSLAQMTGGTVWDIADLGTSGTEIIEEVIKKCISEAIVPAVNFDVHPTSCPNPLNKKSKGKIPMAILGTADFDVTQIDVSTLLINGASPVNSAYEDVATPYEGGFSDPVLRNECTTEGADGYMDLTLKFKTQEILNGVEKGVQYLEITGTNLDGSPITGQDVVWVK